MNRQSTQSESRVKRPIGPDAESVMEVVSGMGSVQPNRRCVTCGKEIDLQMNVCPYCGHDYRYSQGPTSKPRTMKPAIGGLLIMIAGIAAIAMGFLFIVLEPSDLEGYGYEPSSDVDISLSEMESYLGTCGTVCVVCGVIAVFGGVFAVMRKSFALAIVGGVFGIIGLGFFIGAVIAIIGIILLALSRSEF